MKAAADLLHVRGQVCSAIRAGDLSLVVALLKAEERATMAFKVAVGGAR